MQIDQIAQSLQESIRFWNQSLDEYTAESWNQSPGRDQWSIGQICQHLLESTEYFLTTVDKCLQSDQHEDETYLPAAMRIFEMNQLPEIRLQGPPSNAHTRQPAGKEDIRVGFNQLLQKVDHTREMLKQKKGRGKYKHFGLGYFNGREWFQFAEMHWRHHLHQKQRLDSWLQEENAGL